MFWFVFCDLSPLGGDCPPCWKPPLWQEEKCQTWQKKHETCEFWVYSKIADTFKITIKTLGFFFFCIMLYKNTLDLCCRDFLVTLAGWRTTKPLITVYYGDVNHTEMQRLRGEISIHGSHGDKVLGCTLSPLRGELVNQWHVTLPATCLTLLGVSCQTCL